MREVNIKIAGDTCNSVLFIDGKRMNPKKNEFHNYACKYQTENDKIKIELYRQLDIGGIFWFITQLFFFVISIFGIFDSHEKRTALAFDYEADVDLGESNNVVLKLKTLRENEKVVITENVPNAEETANICYMDTKARRTYKLLRIAKILTAIAVVAIVIISIAVSI